MAIFDILSAAQNGRYFANVGKVAGLSESDARTAVAALAPAIAEKLKDKAATDPDAFDRLLDLLEQSGDSSDLDDADALMDAEALKDGGAVLDDLYGSRDQAMAAMGKLAPHAKGKVLESICSISATSVLASLAATNANTLAADQASANASGGGILSMIFAALLKGLLQGVARQVAPRRRRRRTYGYYYGRRPARRRRTRRPGLDDIFKSVLGSRR